jgi:capsular polysaccharide biosynthesis protein
MSAQRPSFERREGGVDLRTLLKIVLRRWIVVVPTIIVAVLVGSQLLGNVKPDYEAKGSLLLLLPTKPELSNTPPAADGTQPDDISSVNPLLDLRASLDRTAAVFSTVMNDNAQKKEIAARGGTRDYEVTVDKDAPILEVSATDKKSSVAIDTVNAVITSARAQIAFREAQRQVAPANRIGTDVLSAPTRASALNAARTRALVAFIALAIAAVLAVALVVESWAQAALGRRERQRMKVACGVTAPLQGPVAPAAGGTPLVGRYSGRNGERNGERTGEQRSDDDESHDEGRPAAKQPGRARAKPRRPGFAS